MPPKLVKYNFFKSYQYAFSGLWVSLNREPNLRIQTAAMFIFVILALLGKNFQFALLQLAVSCSVISLELVNSTIENICDLVHPSFSPQVKIIKDVSAAAVLVMAFAWMCLILYQLWWILAQI